jgi:EAL domain-containing protein (putative c-di-GMP-specific phosphodiesterase class I)
MGGDEFVVLLDGDEPRPDPEAIAARLLEVIREPFWLVEGGTPYTITASVGVAVGAYHDASAMLRDADVAVYKAKSAGRDCHVLFMPEMQAAVEERLAMATDLRAAVAREQLFLEYQPTFSIDGRVINGFEALVRWSHPTKGTVSPLDFIPLAEETGLIVDVGCWVLREACVQMAAWHRAGFHLKVNVNVSVRQLGRDGFLATVAQVLADTGLDPRSLVLEITESALMEDAEAMSTRLGELKALGVQVAIDDFGTGYSSLAYLRQFPVDAIKIDRSFLSDLGRSREAAALMHSLIQLGKNLSLEIVAEGIEQEVQIAYLSAEGCHSGQGFLVSYPLSVVDAEAYLEASLRTAL